MKHLESLNDKQKEAVLYTDGPLLIVAGAGAGKTKTITHRIIHLIHTGINPSSILAVTFTNKAAKEMRERVTSLLEKREHGVESPLSFNNSPFISTFHSLGVHIIKENASLIGLTKYFSIIDDSDAISIIKDIMKRHDIDPKIHEPRKIKNVISKSKGDFITLENYNSDVRSAFQSIVALIWREYDVRLKKEKGLDFDDLLLESVLILRKNEEIRKKYQKRWRYIHIDEYQDTNEVQYELTKLLIDDNNNICVVGDTDQNIYSWRGANIKNMLHFEKDFKDAKIILLEENYRSTKTIISAANSVIKKNEYRVPKTLFTNKEDGEQIILCELYNETAEANFVAEEINKLNKLYKNEEIAILYRANFQSRVLEESLLNKGLPYQVLGVKFFERKEIKDVLSYIKASLNPDSLTDVKRIINVPARGIGKVSLLKLFSGQKDELPMGMKIKINNFYTLLEKIKEYSTSNNVSQLIKYIIKETGIERELGEGTEEEKERLENIKELVSLSLKYDNMEDGLDKLMEDAALASDQDGLMEDKKKEGVKLMTVHSSKGLEFKVVFVVGLEQDLFPHLRTGSSKEEKEEERRLFYVAVTRAEKQLYLSYVQVRTIYGMKQAGNPSEFIYDIPDYLIKFVQYKSENYETIVYMKKLEKNRITSPHRAKKSMGQNFLKSKEALNKMCSSSLLCKDDIVLEIGPGKGALTEKLLELSNKVFAVEKDRDLIEILNNKFNAEIVGGKLILINEDILDLDINKLNLKNGKYKIIANIPYNITGLIIRKFLSGYIKPSIMTLLVQKEVAERIVAKDKKESILSLSVKIFGEPKYIMKVQKKYFSPIPKVDSAIISISNISNQVFKSKNEETLFFNLIRAAFSHKRKFALNNLSKNGLNLIEEFDSLSINNKKRAEDISFLEWKKVFDSIK